MNALLERLKRAWAALNGSPLSPTEKLIMATLSEVQSSISTLGTNVNALLARQDANTESADLDAIKASVDQINTQVQTALTPPTAA